MINFLEWIKSDYARARRRRWVERTLHKLGATRQRALRIARRIP